MWGNELHCSSWLNLAPPISHRINPRSSSGATSHQVLQVRTWPANTTSKTASPLLATQSHRLVQIIGPWRTETFQSAPTRVAGGALCKTSIFSNLVASSQPYSTAHHRGTPPPPTTTINMPYYAKSEDWLHQSALLLQARPETVRSQPPHFPTIIITLTPFPQLRRA
jgi:hypothetical protein